MSLPWEDQPSTLSPAPLPFEAESPGLFNLSSLLLTSFSLHLIYLIYGHMCVGACMYQGVGGSGQLTEVSALLHHVGPRDDTWVTSLES